MTIVEDAWLETLDEPIKMYNLEVEGYHTYFVGGVLVHNYESKYVKEEGRGHTGRTMPNDIIEQMVMDDARKYPFSKGDGKDVGIIIENLGDARWKGWEKWQIVYRTNSGRNVTIHFTFDPTESLFDDFKFK